MVKLVDTQVLGTCAYGMGVQVPPGAPYEVVMYKVTAYFDKEKIIKKFYDLYDAIDFRDSADAHYPTKVTFEQEFSMRELVYDSWNGIMNANVNPLKHIPDLQVRHMVLQVLAWMWCIVFSMYIGSFFVMGVSMIAHAILLAAIVVTVGTFKVAKDKPEFFLKGNGYHSYSRARQHMWVNGQKVVLDKNDPGGEHE